MITRMYQKCFALLRVTTLFFFFLFFFVFFSSSSSFLLLLLLLLLLLIIIIIMEVEALGVGSRCGKCVFCGLPWDVSEAESRPCRRVRFRFPVHDVALRKRKLVRSAPVTGTPPGVFQLQLNICYSGKKAEVTSTICKDFLYTLFIIWIWLISS